MVEIDASLVELATSHLIDDEIILDWFQYEDDTMCAHLISKRLYKQIAPMLEKGFPIGIGRTLSFQHSGGTWTLTAIGDWLS